ncbi:MAG: DUF1947 domain-containing protein [archaeon]
MKKAMNHSEAKEFLGTIEHYGLDFSKRDKFEIYGDIILINGEPMFFYHEKRLVPTLKLLLKKMVLRKITVDMGAVRFVASGADVMRPGITQIEEGIEKDDLVCVVDVTHGKPLSVGKAIFSGEEIKSMNSGKVVKNLHWIGDDIWKV